VMSFADIFYILTFLFLALACALPLVRKPAPPGTGSAGH
jgi:MFS transporter, DHA2 family, multidrug resistance protein